MHRSFTAHCKTVGIGVKIEILSACRDTLEFRLAASHLCPETIRGAVSSMSANSIAKFRGAVLGRCEDTQSSSRIHGSIKFTRNLSIALLTRCICEKCFGISLHCFIIRSCAGVCQSRPLHETGEDIFRIFGFSRNLAVSPDIERNEFVRGDQRIASLVPVILIHLVVACKLEGLTGLCDHDSLRGRIDLKTVGRDDNGVIREVFHVCYKNGVLGKSD